MFGSMMKPVYGPGAPGENGRDPKYYVDAEEMKKGKAYQYFVVLHGLLVCLSIFINGIMHPPLITMRKKLFESTFYFVVAGLMIFTALKTLIQAAFIVPQYILRNDPFTAGYLKTMFTLDMLSDYGILGFSTLMAANRLSAFQMGAYGPLFGKPVIYYMFGLVTGIIVFCGVLMSAMGCTRLYNWQTNTYIDTCPSGQPTLVIGKVLMSLFYVFCILSLSFYVRTYWLINSQRGYLIKNENNRFRPEMVILHQAIMIFGLYMTWIVISSILPFFLNKSASVYFYLSYSLNIASMCIAATFPGLFLTSNVFRREIASWFSLCDLRPHWTTRAGRVTVTSSDQMVSIVK